MILNGVMFVAAVALGYVTGHRHTVSRTDVWVSLAFGILCVLIPLVYAASRTHWFCPPSWKRLAPIVPWWNDPLQFYFELTLLCAGMAVGRGLWANVRGIHQIIGSYAYLLVGLLLGQAIGYGIRVREAFNSKERWLDINAYVSEVLEHLQPSACI